MARINIDDRWWVDPRRKLLIKEVGDEYRADGLALHFWKLGQDAEKLDKKINKKQFKLMPYSDAIIKCELAIEIDHEIYVKGSRRATKYLKLARENGRKGGKISGAARSNKIIDLDEANSSESKRIEASSSSSSSLSRSKKEKNKSLERINSLESEFEKVYEKYPLKKGKAEGFKIMRRGIKDLETLKLLEQAIDRYHEDCVREEREARYIKHFSTFMNCWRDWLDIDAGSSLIQKPKQTTWLEDQLNKTKGETNGTN